MGFHYELASKYVFFFFKHGMELSLFGLQNAGETTPVHAIATCEYREDMTPAAGFNTRDVTKGRSR